jgi:plastocyanin
MCKLRALSVWALAGLVLLVASGLTTGPALAQGYPWPGGFPGYGSYPNPGGMFGPGGFPGFGPGSGLPGYGSYPGPGASGGSTAAATTPTQNVRLTINDFYFLPAEISFPAGTQIAWANQGQTQHTTTSVTGGQWDSGPINPGSRWAARFSVPGTYEYYCTIHPDQMRARLTITAS